MSTQNSEVAVSLTPAATSVTTSTLAADDPRHGREAGYAAHRREGTMCDECLTAGRRRAKAYRLELLNGGPKRVPLGTKASELLNTWNLAALSEKTGISQQQLQRTKDAGPTGKIHRRTLAKILAAGRPVTALGIARRLQALSVLGWSMSTISSRVGIERSNLEKLRLQTRPVFVRRTTVKAVCAAYEELSMRLPAPSRSVSHVRNRARVRGWLPPLVWDDIDDPNASPKGVENNLRNTHKPRHEIDHAVVERFLAGDTHLHTSIAERREIVRRWAGPIAELERLGWKPDRYAAKGGGGACDPESRPEGEVA